MSSISKSEPLASIVIVSWNAQRYLEECLTSLRAVRDMPIEIIVVDNASSDGTPEMVRQKFPEVSLIQNQENLGFSTGNNLGIARSRGRYLCLVNSDVNVLPGCLSELIARAHFGAKPVLRFLEEFVSARPGQLNSGPFEP